MDKGKEIVVSYEEIHDLHDRVVDILLKMEEQEKEKVNVSFTGKDFIFIEFALDAMQNIIKDMGEKNE